MITGYFGGHFHHGVEIPSMSETHFWYVRLNGTRAVFLTVCFAVVGSGRPDLRNNHPYTTWWFLNCLSLKKSYHWLGADEVNPVPQKTSKENMLNCFKDCNIYIFTFRMVFRIWLKPSRWNCTRLEQLDVLCPSQPIHVPYLLMPWRHYEPGHQQAWSWLQKPEYSIASTKRVNNSFYPTHGYIISTRNRSTTDMYAYKEMSLICL